MMKVTAVALALVTASVAIPLQAQEFTPDVHVGYSDLDLTKPEGVRTLDGRIAGAIKITCPDDNAVDLVTKAAVLQCRRLKIAEVGPQRHKALAGAVRKTTNFASNR